MLTVTLGLLILASVARAQIYYNNCDYYGYGCGLSTGARIGIGIGVAVGAALLFASLLYLCRRRRRNLQPYPAASAPYTTTQTNYYGQPGGAQYATQPSYAPQVEQQYRPTQSYQPQYAPPSYPPASSGKMV